MSMDTLEKIESVPELIVALVEYVRAVEPFLKCVPGGSDWGDIQAARAKLGLK